MSIVISSNEVYPFVVFCASFKCIKDIDIDNDVFLEKDFIELSSLWKISEKECNILLKTVRSFIADSLNKEYDLYKDEVLDLVLKDIMDRLTVMDYVSMKCSVSKEEYQMIKKSILTLMFYKEVEEEM